MSNEELVHIIMDIGKSIQANLEFLKKFEGKKSIITKKGLINPIDSHTYLSKLSDSKIKNMKPEKEQKLMKKKKEKKKKLNINSTSDKTDLTEDEEIYMNTESASNLWDNHHLNGAEDNKRNEKIRKELPEIRANKVDSKHLVNKEVLKLPKLTRANSDIKIVRVKGIVEQSWSQNKLKKANSLSLSNRKVLIDSDMAEYLEGLEKFEKGILKLKTKAYVD